MRQVETSNKSMVDNMNLVQNTMVEMTDSVSDSETTTVTMLSKYEETARNVINIEQVVGKLVEELGEGGFMNTNDLAAGMGVSVIDKTDKHEYRGEFVTVEDADVIIKASIQLENVLEGKHKKFDIHVVVNNSVYIWNDIHVAKAKKAGVGHYHILREENPKVVNRRKHPRLSISNACDITLEAGNKSFGGRCVNISAGGFAFACRAQEFSNSVGGKVKLVIKDFDLLKGKALTGVVIRATNDNGTYIVGCRMPEDNKAIQEYVKANLGKEK